MNKVTTAQIKAFMIMRKEMEMELMMRKARYHGRQNVPEDNAIRIEELERQLLFGDALMVSLTDGERLIIKEHIQEEHIWPIVKSIFGERWKLRWEDLPTDRAFKMRLNRALKKLTEVCNRRLDFDFLLECGDLNVKAKNK